MRVLATCGLAGPEERSVSAVMRALEAFDCEAVVLDAAVSPDLLNSWLPGLTAERPHVAAVHAPCPRPRTTHSARSYEAEDVRLAAPGAGERADALALVRPALDTAASVGAGTVVLEGGPLPLGAAYAAVEAFAAREALATPAGREAQDLVRRLRREASSGVVDGWSFALEALVPEAEARGLTLAVAEQRAPAWAGSQSELAVLMARFAGAPLAWWADPLARASLRELLGPGEEQTVALCAPAGTQWRVLPADTREGPETVVERIQAWYGDDTADSGSVAVLVPTSGTLGSWHGEVWSALPP